MDNTGVVIDKADASHLESQDRRFEHHVDNILEYDEAEIRRVRRKVDWRLLPLLTLLYLLAFMDRSNIGNAKVAGMNEELGLTGAQYNMALTVFFFPYCVFEVPSNIVLKLLGASRWMAILIISWGLVMTFQGLVKNYGQLVATRTLLGMTEAGFFPAASYLLTTWYTRWEVQTRLAIFFSAASLAGAFSGLLAFGISQMDGVAGLGGWRWIFILEGIFTVLVGATVPFLMPDSPGTARFLTVAEKELINDRLEQDAGTTAGKVDTKGSSFEWKYLKNALCDWQIYLGVVISLGNNIPVYGFSFSVPTIIHELGYEAEKAQLFTVPPYFVGACSTILFARLADKRKTSWLFIVIPNLIAMVGYTALLAIPHPKYPQLTYACLFVVTCGLYPTLVGIVSWVGNNLAPTFKRAIGMALLMTLGNLGGAVGSNIFLERESPNYWLGYGISLGIIVISTVAVFCLRFSNRAINRRRDAIPEADILSRYTQEELLDMGDKSPLFRYVS